MGRNMLDLNRKGQGQCLEWEDIQKQDIFTMDNGKSMPKMGGESSRIKKQDINIQDLGNKTNEMDTEEKKP